jgi:hypothetical protein
MLKGPKYALKNGTIYNTLFDIGRWAKYLSIYERLSVNSLLLILTEQQKIENKKKKVDVRLRLSRENLMDNLQWPENGMQELCDILMKQRTRVDRTMKNGAEGNCVKDVAIGFAKDWIVSLLFVINPQGRAQAISQLSVKDSKVLCRSGGQVTSAQFKTRATYGSQAINCNPVTKEYIRGYVNHIRPYCLSGTSQSDVLFLKLNGTPHQDIGACVTRIFHQISKYHITTTVLRSMFETEVADAMDNGTVTKDEMSSVIRNNGHSSATFRHHYLKRKSEAAGNDAVMVHNKMYHTPQQSSHSLPASTGADSPYRQEDALEDEDDEDDRPRRRQRVHWTTDELSHLAAWVAQFDHHDHHARSPSGVVKKYDWLDCVKTMTPTGVFHSLHLTPLALREAWRREGRKSAKDKKTAADGWFNGGAELHV